MSELGREELLRELEMAFEAYKKKWSGVAYIQFVEQAYQQVKERVQSYAEHQEITASYIDIVIDLYEQLEKKRPIVTEEWIEEKARELVNIPNEYNIGDFRKYKDFIRSLVEEIKRVA